MSKIFIYKDGNYPLDESNIFLSTEYKSINEFLRQNKDDNFVPLYTYETECVFEKTIQKFESKIQKLELIIEKKERDKIHFCKLYNEALGREVELLKELVREPGDY